MEIESPTKSFTEITVRGYILDLYGQVSNAKFMELLEEARWNHFHGLFESGMFLELGLALLLVKANVNYKMPARLGDVMDIETYLARMGEKSFTLKQTIYMRNTSEAVLEAEMTYVVKDLEKERAIPLVGRMRDMIERRE
ncbi:MAG: thioesterase family protein [Cyanobacteria bacterium P01_A01_bin.137]